jgi:Caspase domain
MFVLRCLAAFAAGSLAILLFVVPAHAERLALVIGNDNYEALPPLSKARNDADAVAETLGQLGFAVTLARDADRRSMTRALSDLAASIEPGAEVVFYFAGHGVEISGRNYLIPIDAPPARPEDEAFLTAESIAVDHVLETIQSRGARVTLLVLDACRDNPFPKTGTRSLGGTRGLAAVAAPEGTFILFSAGTGQAALDGMGARDSDPNSVFTRTLLRQMQDPDQSIQDLARSVRREVEALAATVRHKQRPAYYDELTDDFFLASAMPRGAAPLDDTSDAPRTDQLGTPPPAPASDASADEASDDPLHIPANDIPDLLADDPCFHAGNAFARIGYPYKAEDLLAFARDYAACEPLATSATDLARAIQTMDSGKARETWRVKRGVSEGHMNVRDGRGTGFPVLFRIAEGVGGFTIDICLPPETGQGKDWCLIEHQGQRGWISSGGIERE